MSEKYFPPQIVKSPWFHLNRLTRTWHRLPYLQGKMQDRNEWNVFLCFANSLITLLSLSNLDMLYIARMGNHQQPWNTLMFIRHCNTILETDDHRVRLWNVNFAINSRTLSIWIRRYRPQTPTPMQVKGIKISLQHVPDTDRHLKWHGNFLGFHFYLTKIDAN